tara:strand:+ start:760 stop:864 length:105 start_codon:yes stop_codon:yes gene_type:complete
MAYSPAFLDELFEDCVNGNDILSLLEDLVEEVNY